MRLLIIAAGKIKERGLRDIIDDYLDRVGRHVRCQEVELRDTKDMESSFRSSIPPDAFTIALEVDGEALTSEQLSRLMVKRGSENKGIVAFLIGGADGLPPRLSQQAHMRLSLSKMTLAHRVARVVLAEQLYRAVSIWKGEPYHRP